MKKLSKVCFLVLALGLFLVLSAPLAAQTGALEGVVTDMEGKPLAEITVEIVRTDIKARYETKTDKKGYYVYMGLPAGGARYTVRVLRDGQVLSQISGIRLPSGEFKRLDIDLKKEQELRETQLTDEQKKQLEEQRQAMAKAQSLRENFDLGVKLLKEPTAELVCSSRCPESSPERDGCLATCQGEAEQALKQMAYEEAASAFQRAAEADPSQVAVWGQLGRAYEGLGQTEKGIEAYRKALELKPDLAGLHNNLGQLYVRAGQMEEAQKEFTKAAELNPEKAGAFYYNLGVTFYNAGNLPAAVEPLRKATEHDPERADAYYLLGMCLYNQAEYKTEGGQLVTVLRPGTREAFEKYLALQPEGRFADEAKAVLQAIELTVPAAVQVKKKK